MPRPKQVDLDGDTVTIEYKDNLGRFKLGYRVSGDYRADKVRVVEGQLGFVERATVLHELLHKVWEKAGLHNRLSEKTEELVLGSIDFLLLELLRKNPELREYLFDE